MFRLLSADEFVGQKVRKFHGNTGRSHCLDYMKLMEVLDFKEACELRLMAKKYTKYPWHAQADTMR